MKNRIIITTLFAGPPFVGKTTILQKFCELLHKKQFIEDREIVFGRTRFLDRLFIGPVAIDDAYDVYHTFYAYGGQDWLSTNRRVVLSKIKPNLLVFVANSQSEDAVEDSRLSYKMNQFYWDELQIIENLGKILPQILKIIVINKMDLPGVVTYQKILKMLKLSPSIVVNTDGIFEFPPNVKNKKFDVYDEALPKLVLSTSRVPVFKTIAIKGMNIDNLLMFILTLLSFFVKIKTIPE